MKIKQMFQKDIERNIKGVIKVAQTDDENKYQELDEYVVTRELLRHFSKFYDNYQKGIDGTTDKMGVWISGFFGSGKSHFLKILSYLLENKEVMSKKAVDFFKDKIQDPLIWANMGRTANVDTEVILFNIDSKSSLDNKSKEDAILRVFLKVFYEHQGFYGDEPGVAQMEKYLTKEGVYEDFKREFKVLSGDEWVERRHTFYFDADYVIGALTKVTSMSEESARNWFENGVNNFEISIEKFAKEVKHYVGQKGNNFHLIFLVDEIGQYIGDSRNLMLNLQTLAEDLGTQCKGKVWIMVTSQESIDSIVKVKGDDFSRIQGRFDTRLSLSSVSVDEVIKKRILLKQDYAEDMLQLLYHEQSATLKNLISFKDATADFRGYTDEREFADVYPFLPYQFKLLQNVFEQVRKHGSSGKHLAEGERSMLSAFQESALRFKDTEEGTLVPFFAFYDTIKEFLTSSVVRVIEGVYENPSLKDDEFNVNVLKTLFLIKYVKELPANIENIATLMVTSIDEDKLALKDKIGVSLRKLIRETLIQQNGDIFMFLTDDEQDVNREIKGMKVEEDLTKRELAVLVFDELYGEKSYRYSSQYQFPYNKKMDERNHGNQTSTIGINILSPLSEHYQKSDQELMLMSSGSHEMILKLGADGVYTDEMEEVLKIKEYLRKKNPAQLPENLQNILNTKQGEARERERRVRTMLEDAVKDGTVFINGDKPDVTGATVKDKLNTAFHALVDNVYTKLGYVKKFLESEKDLKMILQSNSSQITLDGSKLNENELATNEVFNFIRLQTDMNNQVRVKILLDRFNDKPYGWKSLDILGLVGELLKGQRIRLRYNAEYLEPEDPATFIALTKASEADKIIVLKRVSVDEKLLKTAREICKEVFNKTGVADDEDGLLKDIRELIDGQVAEINELKHKYQGRKYPGQSLLDKGLEHFGQFTKGLDSVSVFTKLRDLEEDLLTWQKDVVLVKSFFQNQRVIFDQGLNMYDNFLEQEVYLTTEQIQRDAKKLNEILSMPLPYSRVKEIPELVKNIGQQIQTVLVDKKQVATDTVKQDFNELVAYANQSGVSETTKEDIQAQYQKLLDTLAGLTDIFKVDATVMQSSAFKKAKEEDIQKQVDDYNRQNGGDQTPPPPATTKQRVKFSNLVTSRTLSTEQDVDSLLTTLEAKLKEIIKSNRQIELVD